MNVRQQFARKIVCVAVAEVRRSVKGAVGQKLC